MKEKENRRQELDGLSSEFEISNSAGDFRKLTVGLVEESLCR
jgi:hypothetical protein